LLFNISNKRKSVSSDIQTLRCELKKQGAMEFFLTNFKVFGYLMKLSFKCLVQVLKELIILREMQSKSLPNFMIIKIINFIQTSFTVAISFVFSSWIIDEFENIVFSFQQNFYPSLYIVRNWQNASYWSKSFAIIALLFVQCFKTFIARINGKKVIIVIIFPCNSSFFVD